MLSISSVTAGQSSNYFFHDEGKESYYEAEGKGKALSGFESDTVTWKDAEKIVSERVKANSGRSLNPDKDKFAEDLTFSAAKSISVVWGLAKATGDEKTAGAIEEAFDKAVKETFDFIKNNLIQTRDQDGRPTEINPESVKAIQFNHHLSREKDPQLHAHVLILNAVERTSDGQTKAHYLEQLYENKKEIGAMFQVFMGNELEKRGFKTELQQDTRHGNTKVIGIAGLNEEQIKAFSTRSQQIQEKMEEKGVTGGKAAEMAALDTRQKKDDLTPEQQSEIEQEWIDKAQENGIDIESLKSAIYGVKTIWEELNQGKTQSIASEQTVASILNLQGKITQKEAIMKVVSAVRDHGISMSMSNLLKTVGRALNEVGAAQKGLLTLKDGSLSTRSQLAAEFKSKTDFGFKAGTKLNQNLVKYHLGYYNASLKAKKGYSLSDKQSQMVIGALSSSNHAFVEGWAGAGKTTSLHAVRTTAKHLGYNVIGIASSGSAADKLSQEIGIKTYTAEGISMVDRELLQKRYGQSKTVMIVDEVSMLSSKQASAILDTAQSIGAKVIAVGDRAQLKSVGQGNVSQDWVTTAKENGAYFELNEVHRQKGEYREIAADMRPDSGKGAETIDLLKNKGWLKEHDNYEQMVENTVKEYISNTVSGKNTMVIADTNALVNRLNEKIRGQLIEKGLINTDRKVSFEAHDSQFQSIGKKDFAIGDQIMFLQNSRDHEVSNGETGKIINIDSHGNMLVQKDNGKTVEINTRKKFEVEPITVKGKPDYNLKVKDSYRAITHAYARTIHKSQGHEADNVIVATTGARNVDANMLYVAVSRGKGEEGLSIHTTDLERLKECSMRQTQSPDIIEEFTGASKEQYEPIIKEIQTEGAHDHHFNKGVLDDVINQTSGIDMNEQLSKETIQQFSRASYLGISKTDKAEIEWISDTKMLLKAIHGEVAKSDKIAPKEAHYTAVKKTFKDLKERIAGHKKDKNKASKWDKNERIKDRNKDIKRQDKEHKEDKKRDIKEHNKENKYDHKKTIEASDKRLNDRNKDQNKFDKNEMKNDFKKNEKVKQGGIKPGDKGKDREKEKTKEDRERDMYGQFGGGQGVSDKSGKDTSSAGRGGGRGGGGGR